MAATRVRVSDNLRVTQLRAAASTQPLGSFHFCPDGALQMKDQASGSHDSPLTGS